MMRGSPTAAAARCLGLVLLALAVSAAEDQDVSATGKVYTLDAKSFHAFLPKVKYLCVLFVAPDCGECQTFAEEFHDAAKEVAAPGTPLRMAELTVKPGSAEEKIATAYGITGQKFSPGFPTVYMFKDGEMSDYYNWGANAKSMIKSGAIEDWVTDHVPWRPAPPDATDGWKKLEKEGEREAKKKEAVIEEENRRLSSSGEATTFVV